MARTCLRVLICLLLAGTAAAWAAPKPAADAERPAVLGMIAYTDPQTQYRAIAPLAEYLGKAARLQVKLKLYADYFGLLNDIDHESLDLAIVSPIVFAFCMDDPALTYLATSLEAGRPFYHAALLARKDSKILSTRDLAGKRIAFVDPYSASGYVYPAAFLLQSGLVADGRPLYTPVFCGSHEKALRALQEGRADAAATYENFFGFAGHRIGGQENLGLQDFRVLKLLPEQIPNDAVVCRTNLGTDTIRLLGEALHEYESRHTAKDSPLRGVFYTGFKAGQSAAYGAVRRYLETLPVQVQPGDAGGSSSDRPQDAE